ncbi:unnamed protein product [Microthlaspi erraticum]|uniref:SWIM-type domain-containing protein n=2 Tax=Microthlaspi erraticum TaxID=1685480 RepID=A0A6D2IPM0_9BRAS|nr:unnamed protein product [Microthlaspi erraticum]CAA7027580.1 unnamed protein product [Microthlaspi erraticum]
MFQDDRWIFFVDDKRGSKIIAANDRTSYEDFVGMVIEDYKVDFRIYDVQLSYMFSKKILLTLPKSTPPVRVTSCRQLHGFLEQGKDKPLHLCVELKEKGREPVMCPSKKESANIKDQDDDEDGDEDDDEDGDRFDYCDDSDGASSGDEDFRSYGTHPKEEENEEKSPAAKLGTTSTNTQPKRVSQHVKLEISSLNLVVGQQYESKHELETRLKILSVLHQFDFKVDRSATDLFTVNCWVEGCSWRVRATPVGKSEKFTVRVYIDKHTCSVTERSARARQATPDILALLYVNSVGGVDSKVLPKHVAEALNMRFGIKRFSESGYSELPTYLHQIRQANPGTFTRLEVDEFQRFKYLFLAFGASINGFPFLRKVVVVDGTFLKGKYKGTLLIASAQDGNFQIFPIAFAVVDTENDDSWEWFFQQLSNVIQDDEGLALISDRHQSIGNAIKKVYPKASRGVCTYHLYKNILQRFRGRDAFRLVKKAANAFKISDFDATFDEIGVLNPALHRYLVKADVRKWARVHFPGDRYNLTTTNIAESINKALSDARSLPIVRVLDAVRSMMTRWFADRRMDAGSMKTTLTRGVEKLLEKRVQQAKLYKVQAIDVHHAQVTCGMSLNVVNLKEKKCSCRRFDVEKLPCVHAIAAAEARRISPISKCDPYYHKNYFYNAYSTSVMPRDAASPVSEDVASKVCSPPIVRNPPGRPKNSRMKSALEKATAKKRPRKEYTCSRCHRVGHNCKTCKAPIEV